MVFRRIVGRTTLVALLLSTPAAAQTSAGVIAGTARDTSGAVVPGATVTIVPEATGIAVEAPTNGEGGYRVADLAAGAYRLDVALDGFETVVRRVVLDNGQTTVVDVTLQPLGISQSVVVTARRVEEVAQEVPIPVSVLSGVWSRNLLDRQYFEFLTAQPGNSGLYVGLPGDPRTVGVTVRMSLRSTR